ncbi:MAG: Bug family tripartite tricarboxylate transporter substrate binding protein [bacterium]|jgi:tripartite-type tricarboxylate transporter receptor subunit TctC|nr:tripartite tricarboxylate transporter substrate binding protein [Betaproteobacteria bacterium]
MRNPSPSATRTMPLACLIAGLLGGAMPQALAQSFPVKPIRMIVGLGPGGAADTTARLLGQRMATELGQPVLVDNRTGASGVIAYQLVASSIPDGYTLALVTAAVTTLPFLHTKLPYDIEKDLVPVAVPTSSSHVLLVNPSVKATTVAELIALARANPGKLSYASTGVGSAQHMAGEFFNILAKTNILHVAYKGGAESVMATLSGQVEVTYGSLVASTSLINAGKLRALGITGTTRSPLLPSVPTISEAGLPGYDSVAWYGVMAPARTPRPIITRLNEVIVKAGQTAELREAYAKIGLEPQSHTPEQFAELIRSELAKNRKLVAEAGIKAN